MAGSSQESETPDELDQYISEPLLTPSNTSALAWWTRPKLRTRLPLLSKMAIDIFNIPAMSSEPGAQSQKRHISGAQNTVSDQRTSLKSDTIEVLECLKTWFCTGIYAEQDLHAIVAAEGVRMEAELELGLESCFSLIPIVCTGMYWYRRRVLVSYVYQPSTPIYVSVCTGTRSETNCLSYQKPWVWVGGLHR